METILLASSLDGALQAVVIVFMLFLCALCLFAVVVIVRDIIYENSKIYRERKKEDDLIPTENEKKASEDVTKEPQESDVALETEVAMTETNEEVVPDPVEAAKGGVVFSRSFSMAEKYATLSSEYKSYFDDVVRYALSKPGIKEYRHNGSYDYKDGRYKVLRMTIKRGVIGCEFLFIDEDLRNYVHSSDVRIKQSTTMVKVDEPSAVGVAKDGIDLICSQIAADREYKKELAKEKRRIKRQEQKQAEEKNAEIEGK